MTKWYIYGTDKKRRAQSFMARDGDLDLLFEGICHALSNEGLAEDDLVRGALNAVLTSSVHKSLAALSFQREPDDFIPIDHLKAMGATFCNK